MVVPEKEASRIDGGARRGEIAGRAGSAACVGGRADGGPAATRPGRLADPGADLARERRSVVSCADRKRRVTSAAACSRCSLPRSAQHQGFCCLPATGGSSFREVVRILAWDEGRRW
jgi:hypothetical protein